MNVWHQEKLYVAQQMKLPGAEQTARSATGEASG
jgi:hypothetical protein